MSGDVVIYTSSTCGWAVRNYAALFEKGVAFTIVDVKASNETRIAFERQFPYGLTPGLRHGDATVWESLIINDYVDTTFEGRPLLPADPETKTLARQWLYHCDGVVFPALYKAMRDPTAHERLNDDIQKLASPAFLKTPPHPFWNGASELTLVDIAYHVLFKSLRVAALEAVQTPPWMKAWAERVATAPSIVRAEAFMASLRDTHAA